MFIPVLIPVSQFRKLKTPVLRFWQLLWALDLLIRENDPRTTSEVLVRECDSC